MILHASPEDRGLRLDVFLAGQLVQCTRSRIQALNRSGAILVGGRPEKAGYRMQGNETVEVILAGPVPSSVEPQNIPLKVWYEDSDLAVIEKPAGLSVHPGAGTGPTTLVNALVFRFGSLSTVGGVERPGIVHRLDKLTSGLLIVAKNEAAHVRLSRSFQDRDVEKTYLALVHGRPSKPSGDISFNIGRHPRVRTRMSARKSGGREARSTYRTLEMLPGYTLLEVKIHTGRTHQIRVHLSAIGHPVAGDDVYGLRRNAFFAKKHPGFKRHFLHAAELRFPHPKSNQPLAFQSPLPDDLKALLESLRRAR
jgi:23S rRNA pseudouridine1911/1915/1917 synthase